MKVLKNKVYILLSILIMIFGCRSSRSENEVQLPPQDPKPFPELTERNRLLGDLLPERTCYDVIHYLIDLDLSLIHISEPTRPY